MVALAGLKSGHVTKNTVFDCPAAIEIDDHLFHNSDFLAGGDHEPGKRDPRFPATFSSTSTGSRRASRRSTRWGKKPGFGHKWGLLGDADEDAGILPGPEWMKKPENQASAETGAHRSLEQRTDGQRVDRPGLSCFARRLQLATFLCSVANGGTIFQPRLYSHVTNYKGDTVAEIPEGTPYSTLDMRPADLKTVQEGMYDVVEKEGGTGYATARIPGVHMAGKTGTAQHYRYVNGAKTQDLTTWFYCYGPFEKPQYVTCVMVEGGTWGSTAAAPIASEVMKRLFAMDKGGVETVVPLKSLVGNFKGSDKVILPNAPVGPPPTPPVPGAAPVAGTPTVTAEASPDDDDMVTTPAADAPPSSSRSRSGTKGAR